MDKAVILDAAQELQVNAEWWLEFEYLNDVDIYWQQCSIYVNPMTVSYSQSSLFCITGWEFRRKPRTITVTMPVPKEIVCDDRGLFIAFKTPQDRDTALAAIREAMEGV